MHKRTDSPRAPCQHGIRGETREREIPMLFIVAVVTALVGIVILPWMRVVSGVNSASLGWMSEQWLAEYRSTHSA